MGIRKHGNQVNVIDFGLTGKFKDPKTHLYIPYRENKNLTGTAHYTLINTHLGVDQACHDNLQSLTSTTLAHSDSTTNMTILTCASSSVTFSFVKATSMTMSLIGASRGCRMMAALVLVVRRWPQAGGRLSSMTRTTTLVTGCSKHNVILP